MMNDCENQSVVMCNLTAGSEVATRVKTSPNSCQQAGWYGAETSRDSGGTCTVRGGRPRYFLRKLHKSRMCSSSRMVVDDGGISDEIQTCWSAEW